MKFELGRVGTGAVAGSAALVLLLAGCGSSSKQEEPLELGLDGQWKGLVDDGTGAGATLLLAIEDDRVRRILVHGLDLQEPARILPRTESVFDFHPDPWTGADLGSGFERGRLIASAAKDYLLFIGVDGALGMVQQGEPAVTDGSLLDLFGNWRGTTYGNLFGPIGETYSYRVAATCALETCVVTAQEPATYPDGRFVPAWDGDGQLVFDIMGVQATYTVVPRDRLLFDFAYTDTLRLAGVGALALSGDKRSVGVLACGAGGLSESCEYTLMIRD